jgi:hypothetical protein
LVRQPIELAWSYAARIDPRVVLSTRGSDARVLARVWIDVSGAERAVIYVANTASDRFLVRFVPVTAGYDEIARESLAHIVESATDALLSGAEIGVAREDAARTVERETGVQLDVGAPRGPRASIALSYRLDAVADGPLLRHGPELAAAIGVLGGPEIDLLVWLSIQYHAPLDFRSARVSSGARFDGGGARAALGIEWRPDPRVITRAALGVGADVAYVTPQGGGEITASSPFWIGMPIVTALIAAEIRIVDRVGILIGACADADLSGSHFDLVREGALETVLRLWPIRPGGFAGVSLALE